MEKGQAHSKISKYSDADMQEVQKTLLLSSVCLHTH